MPQSKKDNLLRDGNEDLVSIVIPVYNSEKFLKDCLDSVIHQTWQNQEIIVIDDGSTDNSSSILERYSDKITLFSKSNEGLASALNFAVKKVHGKWFKWFSPDDVLYENSIETLVTTAKNLPENTIVYSNWEIIDESNKTLRTFNESNYNDLENFDYNVRLLDGQQINVNTSLIPSLLFQNGCLFQSLPDPVTIDYDFFLRAGILFYCNFFLISKNLVKYRIHTDQLSHQNITKTLSFVSQVQDDILLNLEPAKKDEYLDALREYHAANNLTKKTMNLGLKIAKLSIPDWVTDRILTFYLNKIRSKR